MKQTEALDILKLGRNVFLTGEPGSGKTHTVNSYVSFLRSCGVEPAITASTGIAATHIGGMTIHSWSGIGIAKYLSKYELNAITSKDRLVTRITDAKVLVIDEISMLDASTLELVNKVCQTIRKNEKPFGGIQTVFVGDFFQLPPVSRNEEEPPKFAFESTAWQLADPRICYLSEQYRQEDEAFLGILQALRRGKISKNDTECLLARQGVELSEEDTVIPKLFPHNANVDALNDLELRRIQEKTHTFTMECHGKRALVEQLQRGCLSPETLNLKIGARVMFTKNNFSGKFVNGTIGEVIGFDVESGYPKVKTRYRGVVLAEPVTWSMMADGKTLASLTQLPLRLAWAITVHKSQGMSLDAAFMDLSQAFAFGQGYVALSRVRSLDGLYLGGLNERALEIDPNVLEQDIAFRAKSYEVREEYMKLPADELSELQRNFLLSCGGDLNKGVKVSLKKTKTKEKRYEKTVQMISGGMNIADIARERGLTEGTIMTHLEEACKKGKILNEQMAHLKTENEDGLKEIHDAFRELGITFLNPIRDHLNGRYSYDTIRLARLFYKNV